MAVDFDALNRATRDWKNNHCSHPTSSIRSSDNGRMGMSPSEYLAFKNNETYKANNGQYPEHPFRAY